MLRRPRAVRDAGAVAQGIPENGDEQRRNVEQIELNQRVVKQDVSHAFSSSSF
jgi:hypothetical protein